MGPALPIVIAYLLGSIPFGLIVARLSGVRDIRARGSGNIGATNVWRVAGLKAALWVFLGDIGKGVLAVLCARWLAERAATGVLSGDTLIVVCALAAVLGHLFPLFVGFKGGKGVNTALGAMVVLLPLETVAGCVIFTIVVATSRFVSLGSIAGAVGFFLVVAAEKYLALREISAVYVCLSGAITALILIAHRQNLRRLIAGTENRFSLSARSKEAGSRV
jgi:glycerol-3-phosphate acyltransferase PlsY